MACSCKRASFLMCGEAWLVDHAGNAKATVWVTQWKTVNRIGLNVFVPYGLWYLRVLGSGWKMLSSHHCMDKVTWSSESQREIYIKKHIFLCVQMVQIFWTLIHYKFKSIHAVLQKCWNFVNLWHKTPAFSLKKWPNLKLVHAITYHYFFNIIFHILIAIAIVTILVLNRSSGLFWSGQDKISASLEKIIDFNSIC